MGLLARQDLASSQTVAAVLEGPPVFALMSGLLQVQIFKMSKAAA